MDMHAFLIPAGPAASGSHRVRPRRLCIIGGFDSGLAGRLGFPGLGNGEGPGPMWEGGTCDTGENEAG